jgi:probable rRNA maturation factor
MKASGERRGDVAAGGGEIEVTLLNPGRYPEAAARRLRPWLEALLAAVAPARHSLGVRFAGDRALRRANRDFRGRDQVTDVLSFAATAGLPGAGVHGSGAAGEHRHLGDILISVPAARRQAVTAGHPPERELRLLLLHGVLHCLGYDHETDGGEMERLERRLRRRWLDLALPAAAPADSGGMRREA